ncbi:FAD binding domain-containing protein [Boeremia exigua]|uniref:FAD binding domain-containing protein n=1 Tax=Boeremia exigua TaxID=749465 RepID=UPI001E8DD382|nr:FAD binding domain-containing protein [Boeremia exigua]KAH6632927.1 FAD binding domain-containing protein [Boeremia exigua]
MRIADILSLAILAVRATAQAGGNSFEPQDFNVTAALEDLGVPVATLPKPANETSAPKRRSSSLSCSFACASLKILFGGDSTLSEGSSAYESFTGEYWSAQQGALDPFCVFKPTKTSDVSVFILISRLYQCPFAVKGGGHSAWAGASSIADGITVSMENFKQANVAADKQTVDIGPGLRWVDVYTAVEKDGLSVAGGRMAPVGVPGLVLGGGISHFATKRGWACDNVASFELVTASGAVLDVTLESYPDLYWALRGGGNNFGVVTNFKLDAFPLGLMWGAQRIHPESTFPAVVDAIYDFTMEGSRRDEDAAEIVTFANAPGIGKIAFALLHYAKPTGNASVFDQWNNINAISDTSGLRPMSGMANLLNEGAPANGEYQMWGVASLKMDRDLLDFTIATFFTQEATIADVEKILLVMAVQPITEGALNAMQKNGGNALGLEPENGPYFVLNFNAAWKNKDDESKFQKVISDVISIVKAEAKRRGVDNDFLYMNYGSQYQDPIASYGSANQQRLISISKKYDPAQVFQLLQPGGFKLASGAPNSSPS